MNFTFKHVFTILTCFAVTSVCTAPPASAQVDPSEITDPKLKATEQTYLVRLSEVQRTIGEMTFPFTFSLNRYVGLDPKEQAVSDRRGLEFVDFRGRIVLKVTGNYNAAYNANQLTPNQRVARTFGEVIIPILRVMSSRFSPEDAFDAFGFEISHHLRSRTGGSDYEGKENIVVVVNKAVAFRYALTESNDNRQELVDHAEIYLNGQQLGLNLGAREPRSLTKIPETTRNETPKTPPLIAPSARNQGVTRADAEKLQLQYQSQLNLLAAEGAARFHFVEYSPPGVVPFQNQLFLQMTLRNTEVFDTDKTSIYKRAARSFDLFLAPQLNALLEKVPVIEATGISIVVINPLVSGSTAASSEVLTLFFARSALQRFAEAGMTNQDLINQSVVLANGVRIALDLQRVE
jgi:hypothetical protein